MNKLINIYVDRYISTVPHNQVLKKVEEGQKTINTQCLNFFNFDYLEKGYDVQIISDDGYILLSELLENNMNEYSLKNIRKEHNVMKMYIAGSFEYKND